MSLRSRAVLLPAVAFVASALLAGAHSARAANASAASDDGITLVRQELALAADAPLDITVQLAEPLTAQDTIVVTAYQKIDTRFELTQAIEDDPRRSVDNMDLQPDLATTSNPDGSITVHVPTESINRTDSALQLPTAGLYPIVIDIREGARVVGEMLTFVNRQPAAPTTDTEGFQTERDLGSLNVAVIATITAPPSIPGSSTALPVDAATAVNQLAAYSEFIDLVRPTVSISPEILTANRVDPAVAAPLDAVLSASQIVSQPQVPFDPSSAAFAEQTERFTQYVRDGEDSISTTGELPSADRGVWVSPAPITTEGASMLRDLGFRVVIISPAEYRAADGNKYGVTDFSQLLKINLPGDDEMPMGVIDPGLSDRLLDTRWSSEQSALFIAADLVAWRDQLATQSAPVTGHTIAFGLSNGGVPDPLMVRRVAEMASGTGAAFFTEGLRDYASNTTYQIIDGTAINVTLNATPPVDLNTRASGLDRLSFAQTAVSSMLIEDAGRTERWQQTIMTLWSTSLTDTDVATTSAALTAEFEAIQTAVVPPEGYSFSLSGRQATVPIRITNQSDEPLQVIVQLSAAADKIEFPDGPQAAVLAPNEVTDVKVRVVARTNGSFDVRLDILTPQLKLPVTDATTLRANVNTLTGLAEVLTGAALLILLTWWVHNLRRGRRARRGTQSMNNHPSSRTDAEVTADAAVATAIDTQTDTEVETEIDTEKPPPPTAGPPPSNGVRPAAIESPAASATLSDS